MQWSCKRKKTLRLLLTQETKGINNLRGTTLFRCLPALLFSCNGEFRPSLLKYLPFQVGCSEASSDIRSTASHHPAALCQQFLSYYSSSVHFSFMVDSIVEKAPEVKQRISFEILRIITLLFHFMPGSASSLLPE